MLPFLIHFPLIDPSSQSLGLPYEENGKSVRKGPANVAFEVVNAQIVKEGRKKYVVTIYANCCINKVPFFIT